MKAPKAVTRPTFSPGTTSVMVENSESEKPWCPAMTTPIITATGQKPPSWSTSGSGATTAAQTSITPLRTRLGLQPASSSRVETHPASSAPSPDPAKAMASGTASSSVESPNCLR